LSCRSFGYRRQLLGGAAPKCRARAPQALPRLRRAEQADRRASRARGSRAARSAGARAARDRSPGGSRERPRAAVPMPGVRRCGHRGPPRRARAQALRGGRRRRCAARLRVRRAHRRSRTQARRWRGTDGVGRVADVATLGRRARAESLPRGTRGGGDRGSTEPSCTGCRPPRGLRPTAIGPGDARRGCVQWRGRRGGCGVMASPRRLGGNRGPPRWSADRATRGWWPTGAPMRRGKDP
jgi:hypothetical protein